MALPRGFSIATLSRETRGGGIAVIFKSSYTYTFTKEVLVGCECARFGIIFNATYSMSGLLVYRPPGPSKEFRAALIDAVSASAIRSANFRIIGDLNLHLDNKNDSEVGNFLADLAAFQLTQLVPGCTHSAGHMLDPVFSNLSTLTVNLPIPMSWSDHYLVPMILLGVEPFQRVFRKSVLKRPWHKLDIDQFHALLLMHTPSLPDDPDAADKALSDWIWRPLDTLIPVKWSQSRNSKSSPWYNSKLATIRKACKRQERAWRRDCDLVLKGPYQVAIKSYHRAIQKERAAYFADEIRNSSNPAKSVFSIRKDLKSAGSFKAPLVSSDQQCEDLAAFFIKKVENIYKTFPHTTVRSGPVHRPSATPTLSVFPSISLDEMRTLCRKMKSGSPADPLKPEQFCKSLPQLLPLLCQLINMSLSLAAVPRTWKRAMVVPLLKKPTLDTAKPENLCPISLLPWVSKIAEAYINSILTGFLENNITLDSSQNGFRPGHSTETALLAVTEHLREALDAGRTSALILLDLSAAFDTVSHHILLQRLEEAGIEGLVLGWFSSFLSERTFQVSAPPFTSLIQNIKQGVPQGSALSPTLFILYAQPLAAVARSRGLTAVSYADDTQLVVALSDDSTQDALKFRSDLSAIAEWMTANCLQLNAGKSEILLVG